MKGSLSWAQVAAFRLSRHHLVSRSEASLVDVCSDVCGIQAQVMSAARIAMWARIRDLKPSHIDSALYQTRSIIKISCMRQTLHLLPSAELLVYISALRRSRAEGVRRVIARFGVTEKEVNRLNEAVIGALEGGPLAQRELNDRIKPLVTPKVRAWMERVWSVFRLAMSEGLICYGADRGTQITLVRVDQWLPKQAEIPEPDAKRILLRRYMKAYGPATSRDFSHWSGISMKETTPIWDSLADELNEVTIDEKKASILREDYEQLSDTDVGKLPLRLLPGFDPFLLAHAKKDHLVGVEHYKKVYRNQGWITPVVLVNGRVIGIWSIARGNEISIDVKPFERLSRVLLAAVAQEATSLKIFLSSQPAGAARQ